MTPYPGIGEHWKGRFGERVARISLDAGLSCPNRDGSRGREGCTFCDPASFSPSFGDRRPVAVQLQDGIRRLSASGRAAKFAAYFQPGTNTHAPIETLHGLWDSVTVFPEVVALCVGTRPDCLPEPVLELLASYRDRFGEIWLELGLQSSHDATLERLGRGHTARDFQDAAGRARARGVRVCAHVILGLPGESANDEARTADFLVEAGVEGLKLHHLALVEGTRLAGEWRKGSLRVLEEAEYADRAAAFVRRLPEGTILHRLVGDSAADHLLAPRYDKARVLRTIRAALGVRSV